jgi:hypothetical protein
MCQFEFQPPQPPNEKGRRANPAALPLRLEPAYFTSTMLFSAFTVPPFAVVML